MSKNKEDYFELVKAFDEKVDECMDIYLENADSVDGWLAELNEKLLRPSCFTMYDIVIDTEYKTNAEKVFELSDKFRALKLDYNDEESIKKAEECIKGICQARVYLHLYPYRLMLNQDEEDLDTLETEYVTRLVSEMQMEMYRDFRDEVWHKYLELGGSDDDYVF